ncbi:MAG: NAD(P)/FAD-dependent oxidoreductase [Nitrospirae bacterium]|nr:NAD(P)/FAD-dependent oxidoreductase [Nitrospirota bacterium]
MMRHIIIGGSIAGISAAMEIRRSDAGALITMVSKEKPGAYYRPMIPYLIEKDGIDITFTDDPAKKYGIENIFEMATGIDAEAKEVALSSGDKLGYDRLLIAAGSGPVIPAIPGLDGDGVFALRTREDALGIKAAAKGKGDAVILGGGFVGTKAAIALRHLGLGVTIIEQQGQILPGRLDARGSAIVADAMRAAGIEIITGDLISEVIRDGGAVVSVRLSSGRTVKAGLVIVAAGSRPNVGVLRNSGIKTGRGVLINEMLQTNFPDIYAAGDVVEHADLITGMPAVSALWGNAEEMGRLAGKNMAGGNIKYAGFLSVMNATDILGIPVVSVGLIEPEGGGYEVVVQDGIDRYRKFVFRGDTLVGTVLVGDVANAGVYTNVIKNRVPLGRLKAEAMKEGLKYVDFVGSAPVQNLMG